jgi:hypothetical protein
MNTKIIAYDVFEERIYGYPGQYRHRILWVEDYLRIDGTHPDLDHLLEAAKERGGIDGGARTVWVRPMCYVEN